MLSPDLQRIEHIRDYCLRVGKMILRYGDSFDIFKADMDFQQSVAFSVLQIGELCNGLSEEYRKLTGEDVEWNAIRGLRNIVAHTYGSIKLDILWDTAATDIPALKEFCETQLSENE